MLLISHLQFPSKFLERVISPCQFPSSMPTHFSSHYNQATTPITSLDLLSEFTGVFLVAKSTNLVSVLILSDLSAVFENADYLLLFEILFSMPHPSEPSFLFHCSEGRIPVILSLVLTPCFCTPSCIHCLPRMWENFRI